MTTTIDIRSIDIAALTTIPQLAVTGYISLIKTLAEVQPPVPTDAVKRTFERMQAGRELAEQAIVARLGDGVDLGLERSFDLLIDRLWLCMRSELEFWSIYHHDGIALFGPAQRAELDIDECRDLAAVAEDLRSRLFGGPDASDFLRLPYAQQASHMAGRLQLIKEKGLSATFEELVGARMVKLLHVSQQRYEAMVNARSARETGVVGNLPSSGPGARARSKRLEPLCTGCSRAPRKTGNFRASASRPAHVSRSGAHLVLTGSSRSRSSRASCSEISRSFV
jgi:hypothetical protein